MTKMLVGSLVVLVLVLAVIVAMSARSKPQPAVSATSPPTVALTSPGTNGTVVLTTPASATVATVPAAQTAASQLAALLRQTNSARQLVVNATTSVGACQESPSQGIQEVQQAITIRNNVLSGVNGVQMSAIPGGAANGQLLAQALHASVDADSGFIGWMNDIASSGCPVATNTDQSYQAALSNSRLATNAKGGFVTWWNGVASQNGLPTYTQADL